MLTGKATICILAHNSERTIKETIESCLLQTYKNFNIAIMENGSTDDTVGIAKAYATYYPDHVKVYAIEKDIGFNKNIERCFQLDTEYIILMCADDILVEKDYVKDVVRIFETYPEVGHVSRYYYQFLDGIKGAIRTWHTDNIYKLADNASGLAFRRRLERKNGFRKIYYNPCGKVSELYFVESVSLVKNVIDRGAEYKIIPYDAVAVRVGLNGSATKKAFTYQPISSWLDIIGEEEFILKDYVGFVQIKNYGGMKKLIKEISIYLTLRPRNIFSLSFWFFAIVSVLTPREILIPLTRFYKHRISRLFCKQIKRKPEFSTYKEPQWYQ